MFLVYLSSCVLIAARERCKVSSKRLIIPCYFSPFFEREENIFPLERFFHGGEEMVFLLLLNTVMHLIATVLGS